MKINRVSIWRVLSTVLVSASDRFSPRKFQLSCPSSAVLWKPFAEMSQHSRFQGEPGGFPESPCTEVPLPESGLASASPRRHQPCTLCPQLRPPTLTSSISPGPASLRWVSSSSHSPDSSFPFPTTSFGVTALEKPKLEGEGTVISGPWAALPHRTWLWSSLDWWAPCPQSPRGISAWPPPPSPERVIYKMGTAFGRNL